MMLGQVDQPSSVAVLGHARKHVASREFVAFIPWCVLGVVVGLYFFAALDAHTLARGLGIMILIYAAYSYWTTRHPASRRLAHPDRIHVRISELAFRRLVCVTLVLCGIPLLVK